MKHGSYPFGFFYVSSVNYGIWENVYSSGMEEKDNGKVKRNCYVKVERLLEWQKVAEVWHCFQMLIQFEYGQNYILNLNSVGDDLLPLLYNFYHISPELNYQLPTEALNQRIIQTFLTAIFIDCSYNLQKMKDEWIFFEHYLHRWCTPNVVCCDAYHSMWILPRTSYNLRYHSSFQEVALLPHVQDQRSIPVEYDMIRRFLNELCASRAYSICRRFKKCQHQLHNHEHFCHIDTPTSKSTSSSLFTTKKQMGIFQNIKRFLKIKNPLNQKKENQCFYYQVEIPELQIIYRYYTNDHNVQVKYWVEKKIYKHLVCSL